MKNLTQRFHILNRFTRLATDVPQIIKFSRFKSTNSKVLSNNVPVEVYDSITKTSSTYMTIKNAANSIGVSSSTISNNLASADMKLIKKRWIVKRLDRDIVTPVVNIVKGSDIKPVLLNVSKESIKHVEVQNVIKDSIKHIEVPNESNNNKWILMINKDHHIVKFIKSWLTKSHLIPIANHSQQPDVLYTTPHTSLWNSLKHLSWKLWGGVKLIYLFIIAFLFYMSDYSKLMDYFTTAYKYVADLWDNFKGKTDEDLEDAVIQFPNHIDKDLSSTSEAIIGASNRSYIIKENYNTSEYKAWLSTIDVETVIFWGICSAAIIIIIFLVRDRYYSGSTGGNGGSESGGTNLSGNGNDVGSGGGGSGIELIENVSSQTRTVTENIRGVQSMRDELKIGISNNSISAADAAKLKDEIRNSAIDTITTIQPNFNKSENPIERLNDLVQLDLSPNTRTAAVDKILSDISREQSTNPNSDIFKCPSPEAIDSFSPTDTVDSPSSISTSGFFEPLTEQQLAILDSGSPIRTAISNTTSNINPLLRKDSTDSETWYSRMFESIPGSPESEIGFTPTTFTNIEGYCNPNLTPLLTITPPSPNVKTIPIIEIDGSFEPLPYVFSHAESLKTFASVAPSKFLQDFNTLNTFSDSLNLLS